ncbi:hypothetical protein Cgig2_030040 [Carnegiea gigantea]|uniref:NHL repeat-containing protein 2 n=1 Tax=Carnegiea gigantea TaxID=171969 RepID=A0A9Q1QBY5_9CARY|nr:hypothetical protein Cgig2_030040 [Carnegiea gigantea]
MNRRWEADAEQNGRIIFMKYFSLRCLGPSLSPLPRAPEKVNVGGAWRSLFFASCSKWLVTVIFRFSTAAELSKEVSHEVDLLSFARSTFDHAEGPCHCWLNRSEGSKGVCKKDGPILLLAEAFLEYHRGSQVDRSSMIEKVKLLQQRYPWLHVYGVQSSSSIGSAADLNHLMHVIMEEYISFPILYCSKTFPEKVVTCQHRLGSVISQLLRCRASHPFPCSFYDGGCYHDPIIWLSGIADAACCFLLKDIRDPPLYHDKDVDLNSLHVALKDLKKQLDKKAGDADKLKSTWAKQPEGSNDPFICSSLQNMLLHNPACISVDEDGDRLFLSDSNHHRFIVFDSSGNILAVIGSSPGFEDGDFETAKLMRPAASYYHASEDCLYFVDSENHAIRRADMSTRLVETLYPGDNDKGRSGLWTWILGKLGLRRNVHTKSVEFDSEPLLFPWHLLKSEDNDLLVMNRRLDTMWTINLDRGVIHDIITGHSNIMGRYGQKIMEKVSCLKDLSCNFLHKLVGASYSLDGVPYSGLMSSFVTLGDKLILCDRVGQRVLMLDKVTEVASSIKFSNFGILGLPYWLSGSLERGFPTGNVYGEHLFDHVQSFRLFPGRIDIHLAVDIPHNTELLEPLHECCVWRQVRGAAMEFSGLESTASASEKIGVAQQWYDELDNLPFEEELGSNVSTEEKSTSRRNLEDGKVHIYCVVNASPGTSEVTISAPLYLKLRSAFENCEGTQEMKAAQIAKILKADRTGRVSRDAFISFLLNLDRDLGDLVFIKPLHVKVKFNILNHPKADNSRDIILTDSSIDLNGVV